MVVILRKVMEAVCCENELVFTAVLPFTSYFLCDQPTIS